MKKDEAVTEFKQAVQLKPDWPAAYNNLGVAYMNVQKWKDALEALKQAVKLKPDYAGAHYNLGIDYLMTGDKKAAIGEYNILRAIYPRNADALYVHIYGKQPPKN